MTFKTYFLNDLKLSKQYRNIRALVSPRETREGFVPADCWNRGKWGLKGYIWKGSFIGWFVGSPCRYKRFVSRLGCSSRSSTKCFFPLTVHYFQFILSPSPRKLIRQSCCVACLLMCVYGFSCREEVEREGCVRDISGQAALALLDIFRKGVHKWLEGTVSRDGYFFKGLNILISTFCVPPPP